MGHIWEGHLQPLESHGEKKASPSGPRLRLWDVEKGPAGILDLWKFMELNGGFLNWGYRDIPHSWMVLVRQNSIHQRFRASPILGNLQLVHINI